MAFALSTPEGISGQPSHKGTRPLTHFTDGKKKKQHSPDEDWQPGWRQILHRLRPPRLPATLHDTAMVLCSVGASDPLLQNSSPPGKLNLWFMVSANLATNFSAGFDGLQHNCLASHRTSNHTKHRTPHNDTKTAHNNNHQTPTTKQQTADISRQTTHTKQHDTTNNSRHTTCDPGLTGIVRHRSGAMSHRPCRPHRVFRTPRAWCMHFHRQPM